MSGNRILLLEDEEDVAELLVLRGIGDHGGMVASPQIRRFLVVEI
jgi:hypothetical protein